MLSTCFTNLLHLHHHHFFFNSIVKIFYQTHSGLLQFKNMSQKGECFPQLRNSWSLLLFLAFHKTNIYTLSIPNKQFRICAKKISFYYFFSIVLWRVFIVLSCITVHQCGKSLCVCAFVHFVYLFVCLRVCLFV